MEVVKLTSKEFADFSEKHPNTSFHQIENWGILKQKNNWNYYLLGIKENNEILGACLLLEKKLFLSYKFFYSPRGFLLDYTNKELVTKFTSAIKKFCKKKNGIFIKIDPPVIYKERDINGNIVDNGIDNNNVVDNLIKLGYKHNGFNIYMEDLQPRWVFTLDIKNKTEDEVLNNMESKTRQLIRKNIKNGLYSEEITIDNIEVFKEIMEHTSNRRNFIDRPLSYYKNMLECLGENTKILVTKINIKNYIDNLNNEINLLKKDVSSKEKDINDNNPKINVDKTKKKIIQSKNDISRLEKKVHEAIEIQSKDGDIITLGGIIFMIHSKEILSLFGGAYGQYMDFISPYTTNWNMIKYAIENGYSKYNFYGITGNFTDKKNELYGLYDFKRGFGGTVEEYIGEFNLIINKPMYVLYNIAFSVYLKIRKFKR